MPFGSIWRLKNLCIHTKYLPLKKFYISLYSAYQYENNSSVAWNSSFKGEPCFPHGMKSIFISGHARIGENCVIFQQVTIGSNTILGSKNMGAPIIGNNCYISAGAKIIGKVKIGNNVRIVANTVVYKDVPDNSVVISNEQKIIIREQRLDNRFFSDQGIWVYYDEGEWTPVHDKSSLIKFKNFIS